MRLALVMLMAISLSSPALAQKNSTRKIRIKPGDFSSQCGSAINWRANLQAALKESKATGKPVFWYVPTLPNTFMDRKPVIDRYMLAGPFSWPRIIDLLNDHTIP